MSSTSSPLCIRYCSICLGHQPFNYMHVIGHVHRSNINRLPPEFWKMTDDEIQVYLQLNKKRKT